MKNNIPLILIALILLVSILVTLTVNEKIENAIQQDCPTEKLNLQELNRRLSIDSPDWEREMNTVDLQYIKNFINTNC